MKKLASLVAILWLHSAVASDYPRVDEDLEAYDDHVAQLERDFAKLPADPRDKTWVKAKLQHMVNVDQYMRRMMEKPVQRGYSGAETAEFNRRMQVHWLSVDKRNTDELKELLKIYPWFTIGEFDAAADHNAWLLVQHADHDPAFQRHMLTVLEPLAARRESSPKLFAYLFDRVATSLQKPEDRKLQRYGTQGQCTGPGTWEPFPVEDPANLDARRAAVGLEPLAQYQKGFASICHESTEETFRRAREAAGKK
jgi:hypothetical protein